MLSVVFHKSITITGGTRLHSCLCMCQWVCVCVLVMLSRCALIVVRLSRLLSSFSRHVFVMKIVCVIDVVRECHSLIPCLASVGVIILIIMFVLMSMHVLRLQVAPLCTGILGIICRVCLLSNFTKHSFDNSVT
uniref:Uncharacterized protein n=1 Tax=Cacopsylla melanoneura TaxID=428564 RepID=A0A8D8X8Q9_9HEMI